LPITIACASRGDLGEGNGRLSLKSRLEQLVLMLANKGRLHSDEAPDDKHMQYGSPWTFSSHIWSVPADDDPC